ncbi:Aste57867_9042 [Aphanomyces stellatus]|uniref:Aste57867_9042 protein n=1 Tax=Aphanomyces stellatus TaxID=120398 RepID=A0A485KLT4_9STRA|nr:hypothetical protein As57867_009006 [Aphanomyces stellatus]VFT85926.1 Aste57867_9042 [Aphanomyces stellatus]
MGGEQPGVAKPALDVPAAAAAALASLSIATPTTASGTPSSAPTSKPASTSTTPSKRSPKQEELIYWVKETLFLQRNVLFICQNINGPCPLLAICNVLLLRGHLNIDAFVHAAPSTGQQYIYARDVVQVVEARLRTTNQHFNEAERATLDEVIALLQTLQVGLDVNVQFHDVGAFEYTAACAIFDLLDMRLVHGWLVDPQDTAAYSILAYKSYNQIVERLIDYHSVLDTKERSVPTLMKERSLSMEDAQLKYDQIASEGPLIDRFLADSASQLTYCGLVSLHEQLKERELAVFFRNNHFATLFKWQGALYLLVTDAGYYDEPTVIWEKLDEIDGDSEYFTTTFTPVVARETKQQSLLTQPQPVTALFADLDDTTCVPRSRQLIVTGLCSDDFAMALRLQQEEDAAVAALEAAAERAAKGALQTEAQPRIEPEGDNASIDPLTLSAEELQMQREAEEYYKKQRMRQLGLLPHEEDRQTSPVANPGGQPRRTQRAAAREGDDSNNCVLM